MECFFVEFVVVALDPSAYGLRAHNLLIMICNSSLIRLRDLCNERLHVGN